MAKNGALMREIINMKMTNKTKLDQIRHHLMIASQLLLELEENSVVNIINKEFLTNQEAADFLGITKGSFCSRRSIKNIILHNYGKKHRPLFAMEDVKKLKFDHPIT